MNSSFESSASSSFRITQPRLRLPVVRGVIDRGMLLNFRCEPAVLARLVPAPFRPKLGWSAGRRPSEFDGLELRSCGWRMEPLVVERIESSFFHNVTIFPPSTAVFDSALLVRCIQHEWHGRGRMLCGDEPHGT